MSPYVLLIVGYVAGQSPIMLAIDMPSLEVCNKNIAIFKQSILLSHSICISRLEGPK